MQTFLAEVVPDTTARLQISEGLVADTPTPTPQYVRTKPLVPVLRFKSQILYQLRTTAANSILFALASGQPTVEDKEFRRLLARIVEQFGDDPHWENFMSRGLSRHADENYEDALTMYEKARTCIQADERIRDDPTWRERVRAIEMSEGYARRRETLERLANNGMEPPADT